jgi:hypothetical protein
MCSLTFLHLPLSQERRAGTGAQPKDRLTARYVGVGVAAGVYACMYSDVLCY